MSQLNTLKVDGSGKVRVRMCEEDGTRILRFECRDSSYILLPRAFDQAKSRGLREGVRMAQAPYAAAAVPVRVSPVRKPQPSDAPAATGEVGEKEAAPPERDDGMT